MRYAAFLWLCFVAGVLSGMLGFFPWNWQAYIIYAVIDIPAGWLCMEI